MILLDIFLLNFFLMKYRPFLCYVVCIFCPIVITVKECLIPTPGQWMFYGTSGCSSKEISFYSLLCDPHLSES